MSAHWRSEQNHNNKTNKTIENQHSTITDSYTPKTSGKVKGEREKEREPADSATEKSIWQMRCEKKHMHFNSANGTTAEIKSYRESIILE